MKADNIDSLTEIICQTIGARIRASNKPGNWRRGVAFWFDDYARAAGPIFSLSPTGLRRHRVEMKFGAYSSSCIEHINSRAGEDEYVLARALISEVAKVAEVTISPDDNVNSWKVSPDFCISAIRKTEGQSDVTEIVKTVEILMLPMMAALAELIGYLELVPEEELEGELKEITLLRRERNPRNRLLCLAIHGERCSICGLVPSAMYGEENGSILEIHHIEPLSEIEAPKAYDPAKDLIPLCPNCHRALHTRRPALLPADLRQIIGT